MNEQKIPTLYEWAGGAEAIEKLVEAFYDLTLQDQLLRPLFEHMAEKHRHYVALWISEVFGGPADYTGIYGEGKAHAYMIRKHLELHFSEAQRVRWVQLMQQAADVVNMPADPEFRSAFVAYFEWGTRMEHVFHDAPVPDGEPVPKWGWGERKPYVG